MSLDSENSEARTADAAGTDSEQYRVALHRYLARRLHNAEDAQDLAQEAYVRFLQIPHVHAVRRPRGYLFRIAVNLIYEFRLRPDRKWITYDSELLEERAETLADPASKDLGERLSSEEQLDRVLAQIPVVYRKVLLLHKRDGRSYGEIAEELGLSRHSVQKYLARAIAYGRLAKWER